MNIRVRIIPHENQAYPTCGDYWVEGQDDFRQLTVFVSDLKDWRMEMLVAVHEIIEALLLEHRGVDGGKVSTDYDKLYELARFNRGPGGSVLPRKDLVDTYDCNCPITDDSEPGDDRHSPYQREHTIATSVERLLAAELDIKWQDYCDAVGELP